MRLDFSRGGVSTSVAVRGAGTDSASAEAHATPGPSATLLSYRPATPGRQPPPRERASGYAFERWTPPRPEPVDAIDSEDLEELTAPGLDDLKGLIDEAAAKRAEMTAEIARSRAALARAQSRLRFARAFIIRLLTVDAIPDLAREVDAAAKALAEQEAELEACFVEVDFGFDAAAAASYAQLLRAFEALAACDAIWDITPKAQTDAAAAESITRTRVRFSLAGSEVVRCRQGVGRMENVAGRDIYLFPGFVMVREDADDFALVEYRELEVGLSPSQFIEEEEVPADAERVGETWRVANKDGPSDAGVTEADAAPMVVYGEMVLRTPSGLGEVYVVSSYSRATDFAIVLDKHREALAALQAKGGVQPSERAAPAEGGRTLLAKPVRRPAPVEIRPRSFVADWATLALLLAGLTWGVLHARPAPPPVQPPAASTPSLTTAAAQPVARQQVPQKPVRKRASSARAAPADRRRAGPAAHPPCSRIRATINPEAVTCY